MPLFRRWWFWVGFFVLSALCVLLTLRGFSLAFPLVTMDLRMDRQGALEAARDLAARYNLGPVRYRQAAAFRLNSRVQTFVELEAGGNQAFVEMLEGDLFSPYTWTVRNFFEGKTNETVIWFTPQGAPFGFRETVPEDRPGAAITNQEARTLAEAAALGQWQIDLQQYQLVEESQEVRIGGRSDHTLVYERSAVRLGDGRYRMRLVISGDRLTELSHFIKIPEAFERRYEEMRSANNSIATAALFIAGLLYVAGGCVVGLFLLLRERWVIWRHAVAWGSGIALLQVLARLNRWPLLWMEFDTAVSASNFIAREVAEVFLQLTGAGLLLSVSFMAAENLTRRAFPEHLQLWKVWSPRVAASPAMLGRTVAGYLLVAVFFAYEVALYYVANRSFGWWTPSDALFDPNVLATYLPWLSPVAVSLQASFLEECLFRAVPLACAVLLGRRFGGRNRWLVGILILQAVIFAAGHANYPAQPSWARLVELIIPGLCFGGIYLIWGLVPVILLHFAYDVVWRALPLFAADTPGLWVDQTLVVVLTALPLLVVAVSVLVRRGWATVPDEVRNRAWSPSPAPAQEKAAPVQATGGIVGRTGTLLRGAGVAGIILWLVAADFHGDAPPLPVTRLQATLLAGEAVVARGFNLTGEWRELSTVAAQVDRDHRFVWQQDPGLYTDLLGHFLDPPRWQVRFARFSGDVAERAEEVRILVGADATVARYIHRLPEGRPGATLDIEAARQLAWTVLHTVHGLDASTLKEVSSEPRKLPQRQDWKLVFAAEQQPPLEQGEARYAVYIAGDEVTDTYGFIHVPEVWERQERNRASVARMVQMLCVAAVVLVFVTGAVIAIIRWSRGHLAVGTFVASLILLGGVGFVNLGNSWPRLTAQFSTAQPFLLQAALAAGASAMWLLLLASVSAIVIGLAHRWLPPPPSGKSGQALVCGAALGAGLAGLAAVSRALSPSAAPSWVCYEPASDYLPVLGAALATLGGWITGTVAVLLVAALVNAVSRGWSRWQKPLSVLFVLSGLVVTGTGGIDTVPLWLATGILTGAVLWGVYVAIIRHHLALIPVATAIPQILDTLRQGIIGAYPGARSGAVLAVVLIAILALGWMRRLTSDTGTA